VVVFELLHRFDMVKKSRSLSAKELDLIEFLVDQVASFNTSLVVEVACEDVIDESPTLPSAACEAVEFQSDIVVSSATPPAVVGKPVVVVRSSTPPAVTLELHASCVIESFEAKPPDLPASEVGSKGAALMWSCQSARLAAKSRGGTKLHVLPPRHRLHNKVVSRRHFLTQGCVSCISYVISLLLLLSIMLMSQAESSSLPGVRRWRILVVVLDVASSWFMSHGAAFWIRSSCLFVVSCYHASFVFPCTFFLCA
jgi:hypothetical protein